MSDGGPASVHPVTRIVIVTLSVGLAVQALVLWASTGRAGYTRYLDPARAKHDAGTSGLADLFDDTGIEDDTGPLAGVANRFALGLLPSGGGKHLISVLTIGCPAGLVALVVGLGPLLRRRGLAVCGPLLSEPQPPARGF